VFSRFLYCTLSSILCSISPLSNIRSTLSILSNSRSISTINNSIYTISNSISAFFSIRSIVSDNNILSSTASICSYFCILSSNNFYCIISTSINITISMYLDLPEDFTQRLHW
jgi:hypothetical protein